MARIKYFLQEVHWSLLIYVPPSWVKRGSTDDFVVWELPSVAPFAALHRKHMLAFGRADDPWTVVSTEPLNVLLVSGAQAGEAAALPIPPRRTLQRLLQDPEIAGLGAPAPSPVTADARRSAPEHISVTIEAGAAPGVLFIAEAYHPWWTATVDGSPAAVWRAQSAFLAVPLAAGRHQVELWLRPPRVVVATQAVSAIAWVALPLLLIGWVLSGRNVT